MGATRRILLSEAVIEIKDLTKDYVMGSETLRALDHVNLTIDKGEFVAVMGSSGSGKSTLLNLLGCLDTPSDGSYRLRGKEVAVMDDDQLAKARGEDIGFVFQTFNLLPRMTALPNVALPLIYAGVDKQDRFDRAGEMLHLVGLSNRATHRPNELSGGQRQRVAIARALINKPAIILADEPTGNLDSATSVEIMDIFTGLHQQGNTIVMVTHEDDIAERAERRLVMRDGRILEDTR